MSVQFGRWNFDGMPAAGYLEKVRSVLAPYGPDGGSSYTAGDVLDILYYPLHTTKESRREKQPYVLRSGAVITWDGRLDNRAEFIVLLRDSLSPDPADVSIVATAYERWGTNCFARLIGDWALSIWLPNEGSLILAKDAVGTKHLYYSVDDDQITWSTVLDPLVLFAGKTLTLSEEYIAGWLGMFPATHLTPYVGVHSVPPSYFVQLDKRKRTLKKYWNFDPNKRIRYRTDADYEQHFRTVFEEAVRRRLRSDTPILAELSGGMDSSSIVCVSDSLISREAVTSLRLDTISYYDNSEPNWNERPYFTQIEERRGRPGWHIDVSEPETFELAFGSDRFMATPGSGSRHTEAARQFIECMKSGCYRVLLSGIAGDEVLGGVPAFAPELADLMARARFRSLARQLKMWALSKRKPWIHLLLETARGFFPCSLVGIPKHKRPPKWLDSAFVKRQHGAFFGYEERVKLFGARPSFQDNLGTLEGLRRQLACSPPSLDPRYEKRYPYLDRDLLEFLYAIPREQLIRPGQRRSLMRRALVGIVPDDILSRKRKAFVVRGPLLSISAQEPTFAQMAQEFLLDSLGLVDAKEFVETLRQARKGERIPTILVKRTLCVEHWLRYLNSKSFCYLEGVGPRNERRRLGQEHDPGRGFSNAQGGRGHRLASRTNLILS